MHEVLSDQSVMEVEISPPPQEISRLELLEEFLLVVQKGRLYYEDEKRCLGRLQRTAELLLR